MPEKPRIILLGHTSAGKTTLLRTLLRRCVGEIAERANVTQTQDITEYNSLQAVFVDSPGFQQAGKLSLAIEYDIDVSGEPSMFFDVRAYAGIRGADAAIYVASLEVAPDDGHQQELKLVRNTAVPVTAVLNKCGESFASKSIYTRARYDEWTRCFKEHNVDYVRFDAHFDNLDELATLYELICLNIPAEKANRLRYGIARFMECLDKTAESEFLSWRNSIRM